MTGNGSNLSRRRLLTGMAPVAACYAATMTPRRARADEDAPLAVLHGDGQRDQTEELRQLVNTASGGVLLTGTIRIRRPIEVLLDESGYKSFFGDGTARVIMSGSGPAFRFIGTHGGTADPHTVKPNVWERQRMPCIDGIGIEGDHEQASGIEAIGTMGMVFSRLHIRHCHHGIHLRKRNRNLIIAACHIYDNRGVGVYYDDVDLHQSNIGDSHISYNAGGGVVSRGGNVRNIHIGNCDLEGNHPASDAPAESATANVLIDCRESALGTAEVAITGCTIQHTARSPDSANIRILGHSQSEREGHVTISGNVMSDVQTNVHFNGVRGATITGNTFWMGFTHNLLLEDSAELTIGSNNFNRNPRYRHSQAETATHDIVVRSCEDVTFHGNVVSGVKQPEGAVRFEGCQRLAISGCVIHDCNGPHLVLNGCRDVVVGSCVIGTDGDSTAVRVRECEDLVWGDNAERGSVEI